VIELFPGGTFLGAESSLLHFWSLFCLQKQFVFLQSVFTLHFHCTPEQNTNRTLAFLGNMSDNWDRLTVSELNVAIIITFALCFALTIKI
jgi:hypothetical protein